MTINIPLTALHYFFYADATNLARAKGKADADYYSAVKASEANKVGISCVSVNIDSLENTQVLFTPRNVNHAT